jgi:hypothetical protein
MSTRPWNDWYHCMGSTYGTWLPGDARGFRTRHHREHIEGDYRNPPPKGMYEARHQQSKDVMQRDVVYLTTLLLHILQPRITQIQSIHHLIVIIPWSRLIIRA